MLRWLTLVFFLLLAPAAFAQGIDLNTADLATLDSLPGIGPAKGQAIINHRERHGPFERAEDVIEVSGIGPATWANIQALVVVGSQPPEGEDPEGEAPDQAPADGAPSKPPAAPGPPTNAIDINTATLSEMQKLPGIGATKAEQIIADREANGPFQSCQDLSRVPGIGPATVANVADRCTAN